MDTLHTSSWWLRLTRAWGLQLNDVELDLVWVPMGPLQGRAESLDMSLGAPWPQSQGLEPAADEEKQSLMMAKHWAARMRYAPLPQDEFRFKKWWSYLNTTRVLSESAN